MALQATQAAAVFERPATPMPVAAQVGCLARQHDHMARTARYVAVAAGASVRLGGLVGLDPPDLDLVVAFDRGQERILREWAGADDQGMVQLLTAFDPESSTVVDVPDPYYSDAALFDTVLVTIERASTALFRQLVPGIRQGAS